MQLRLIFEGDEPLPQNFMSDVLRLIDRRLFAQEKKALWRLARELPQEFPQLELRLTKEQLAQWRQDLNRQYQAGEFSMLYVESVRQGSIEYLLTVGAWVPEYAVLAICGIVGMSAKDAIKDTEMYKELTRHIRYYLIQAQGSRLIQALLEMSKRYNQIPPTVQEIPEVPPGPRRRLLDMGSPYSELEDPSRTLRVAHAAPEYLAAASPPVHTPLPAPTDGLKVESIVVRRPVAAPHVAEVRIKRIVVKVPPITTYSQVADELNRAESHPNQSRTGDQG
jgi:hypothetical protein